MFDISRIMKPDALLALNALAQDVRLDVFRLLVRVGPEGLLAGEIARELSVSKSTLSFHLKELVHGSLIEAERRGREIVYRLREDGVRRLFAYLMEDCCQGRPELCAGSSTRCES